MRNSIWLNTLRPKQNGDHFADNIFKDISSKENLSNFNYNLTEMCSLGSNWQYGSIGSDNDLTPNKQQAITWISDAIGYWCIFASLSLNELMRIVSKQFDEV